LTRIKIYFISKVFGMEGPEDIPTKNLPNDNMGEEQTCMWIQRTLDEFIDHQPMYTVINPPVGPFPPSLLHLPDGKTITINVTRAERTNEIRVSHDRLKAIRPNCPSTRPSVCPFYRHL
jgi:hypothetical protein